MGVLSFAHREREDDRGAVGVAGATLRLRRAGGDIIRADVLQENGTLFEFSLCLSRACLGKMIVFIYKWYKNGVSDLGRCDQKISFDGRKPRENASSAYKTAPYLSAFPMFVPSLSWQNDRFYI